MTAPGTHLAQAAANRTVTATSDAVASVSSNDSVISIGAVVAVVVAVLVIYVRLR